MRSLGVTISAKARFAVEERGVPKIVAVPIEQIEREHLHRRFSGQMRDFVRIRLVDARLNQAESRTALAHRVRRSPHR